MLILPAQLWPHELCLRAPAGRKATGAGRSTLGPWDCCGAQRELQVPEAVSSLVTPRTLGKASLAQVGGQALSAGAEPPGRGELSDEE